MARLAGERRAGVASPCLGFTIPRGNCGEPGMRGGAGPRLRGCVGEHLSVAALRLVHHPAGRHDISPLKPGLGIVRRDGEGRRRIVLATSLGGVLRWFVTPKATIAGYPAASADALRETIAFFDEAGGGAA